MATIQIARGAHLVLYIELFREIGVPVDRELGRSKLPSEIEAMPDAYYFVPFAFDFVRRCSLREGIADPGFLAARRGSMSTMSRGLRQLVRSPVNGLARLRNLVRHVAVEDSELVAQLVDEGSNVRVVLDQGASGDISGRHFTEWLQLQGMINCVRDFAGPTWRPNEMTFMSQFRPCDAALEAYNETRLLFGQRHTSILVPTHVLATPCRSQPDEAALNICSEERESTGDDGASLLNRLRMVLRPYLSEGTPNMALAAEMLCSSTRSLQRILATHNRSFSDLVQEAQMETACALLKDTPAQIVEVAYATGYKNPQHFSRAFRRTTGMSPRRFRKCTTAAY